MSNTSTRRSSISSGPSLPWAYLKVCLHALPIQPFTSYLDPYPYADYAPMIRSAATKATLLSMERETIVLLENRNHALPLSKSLKSIALIGPSADKVLFG